MSTIGANLKQERLRLNLNQEQFAELGGVKKRAQISYEQDERVPDADYLAGVAAAGVDIQFVLTGKVSTAVLSDDESDLIGSYRALDVRGRVGVLSMLQSFTSPTEAKSTTSISGKVGQVVQGDQEANAPIKINVGNKKTSKKQ